MTLDNDESGASVKFPPPIVFILFMLMAYGLHYFLTVQIGNMSSLLYIGLFFVVLGFAILFIASYSFKRAQTNIEPWKPTTKIISSGIFANLNHSGVHYRRAAHVVFAILRRWMILQIVIVKNVVDKPGVTIPAFNVHIR